MRKISLVTGGSSGLGYEIAKCLLEKGFNVCLVSRSDKKLNLAVSKLSAIADSKRLISYSANVGKEDEVKRLFEFIAEKKFLLEKVFNTAGIGLFGHPESISKEMIDSVFEGNLLGTIIVSSHAIRAMNKKGGLIVNIMSTAAQSGRAQESVYCAAKWGARGFTESLQAATKGTSIRIIAVYPGGMNTPFWSEKCGLYPNTSTFMNPSDVARQIVHCSTTIDSSMVSDLIINRTFR
jgi:NAD(P)-dependent dehydrogenase (short-subunit alcohol dehydrogenase family)